jgi:hypothetical protein
MATVRTRTCAALCAALLLAGCVATGATERPQTWPLPATGLAPLDAYVLQPTVVGYRELFRSFRGLLHATRDILFPEFRTEAVKKGSFGLFDTGFEDESHDDIAARLVYRDTLLGLADKYEVPALYAAHPDFVRYAVAGGLGLLLLTFLMVVRTCTGCCARVTFKTLFALTRNDAFADDNSDGAYIDDNINVFNRAHHDREEEAARLQAEAAQRESKKSK